MWRFLLEPNKNEHLSFLAKINKNKLFDEVKVYYMLLHSELTYGKEFKI